MKIIDKNAPEFAFTWEYDNIKFVTVQCVDLSKKYSNDVILLDVNENIKQLTTKDYNIIDIPSNYNMQPCGLQTLLNIFSK